MHGQPVLSREWKITLISVEYEIQYTLPYKFVSPWLVMCITVAFLYKKHPLNQPFVWYCKREYISVNDELPHSYNQFS